MNKPSHALFQHIKQFSVWIHVVYLPLCSTTGKGFHSHIIQCIKTCTLKGRSQQQKQKGSKMLTFMLLLRISLAAPSSPRTKLNTFFLFLSCFSDTYSDMNNNRSFTMNWACFHSNCLVDIVTCSSVRWLSRKQTKCTNKISFLNTWLWKTNGFFFYVRF